MDVTVADRVEALLERMCEELWEDVDEVRMLTCQSVTPRLASVCRCSISCAFWTCPRHDRPCRGCAGLVPGVRSPGGADRSCGRGVG